MDELKNMLKAFVNSQNAFNLRVENEFKEVKEEIKNSEKRLTNRIDKLGRGLAFLEDDRPFEKSLMS